MRFVPTFPAILLCSLLGSAPTGRAEDPPPAARVAETARRHGLDPTTPPEARIKATPAEVLKMFEGLGGPAPTPHALTDAERAKVAAAFAALPPLHRRILAERLRGESFLDGMPNTALTSTVNPDEPDPLFDLTIRAGVLRETTSEWLTQKERTCFDAAGSPLSVAVEAGDLDALVFVLLHEATHMVDASLGLTPAAPSGAEPAKEAPPATEFTRGVWVDRLTHAPPYRDPLLDRLRYRAGGRVLPIGEAEAAYRALGRTPFVSLYGSSNWHDDLAEYVAVYHFTETLKQPYRIVVRKPGGEVFRHEPMASDLVRRRIGLMKRFDAVEP